MQRSGGGEAPAPGVLQPPSPCPRGPSAEKRRPPPDDDVLFDSAIYGFYLLS